MFEASSPCSPPCEPRCQFRPDDRQADEEPAVRCELRRGWNSAILGEMSVWRLRGRSSRRFSLSMWSPATSPSHLSLPGHQEVLDCQAESAAVTVIQPGIIASSSHSADDDPGITNHRRSVRTLPRTPRTAMALPGAAGRLGVTHRPLSAAAPGGHLAGGGVPPVS